RDSSVRVPNSVGGARFYPDHSASKNHLATPELPPDGDLLGRINAVDLEHMLGEIQPHRGNLHVDGSSCDSSNYDHPTALQCRGAGAVHHIMSRPQSTCPAAWMLFLL